MTRSTDRKPGAPRLARASRYLLALTVAGSALAVGTVHAVTLCVVTGALLVAMLLAGWGVEPNRSRSAATILVVTGVALTAYTALQCVPIPAHWLSVVAPYNADVWSRALMPLHEAGPAWMPITLDPVATRVEVLKGVAYVLAFVTALWAARRAEGAALLSATIVVTGLVLAVAAVLHPAFGATKLFGVYAPTMSAGGRHLAPLMNPNNLAGYLNIAFCLSLSALLSPQPRVPRPIAGAVVLLLAAAQVWVASRSGVVAMVVGAFVVATIARLSRARRQTTSTALALLSGVAMVAGVVLIAFTSNEETSAELLDTNVSKFKIATSALRLVRAMPLFGSGRGAFESVYPAFRTDPGHVTYAYPENFVAQWLGEWGLPLAIVGLLAIAFALRPNVVLARSTTAGGAWAALVALVLQNLADLGTEVPGLMLAGVVCAAIVAAGTPGRESRWRAERWSTHPRGFAACAAVAGALALWLAGGTLGSDLHDDQGALHEAALRPASVAQVHALARAAMLRHPAEPYLPFSVSLRAVHVRDDPPMPWIGATLERAPAYGAAHLMLARVVASRSPSQARLEYRVAMEQWSDLIEVVLPNEAARVVGGYSDAMELVPEGNDGVGVMELLGHGIQQRLPATVVRVDVEMVARSPAARGPALRSADAAVRDLEDGAPWCEDALHDGCVRTSLARAIHVEQLTPNNCEGYALYARARAASADVGTALDELDQAADKVTDRLWCLQQVEVIARSAHADTRAEAALEKIVAAGCSTPAECTSTLRWTGAQYESMGRRHKALAVYKRALEQVTDDDLLGRAAGLAAAVGLHVESASDYDQLARRHPEDPRWRRAAEEEHRAAIRDAVRL